MKRLRQFGWCPNVTQELLLIASLTDGPRAKQAWMEWQSRVNLEELDVASNRLLPLLYRNLTKLGVRDPAMAKFKGYYRRTWYENQFLLDLLSRLIRLFEEADIRTLILKGVPLILEYYRDEGVRIMSDVDLLVSSQDAEKAIDLLQDHGWTPFKYDFPPEALLNLRHSGDFRDGKGRHFDLHWHLLRDSFDEDIDDIFWKGSGSAEVRGRATRALNPTDQLLHVCLHGAEWNPIHGIQWVADASQILNTSFSQIDWSRYVLLTRRAHAALPVRDTLLYLRDAIGFQIPPRVLAELNSIPTSLGQRVLYKYKTTEPARRNPVVWVWLGFQTLERSAQACGVGVKPSGWAAFLMQRWSLTRVWEIPLYVLRNGPLRLWQSRSAQRTH
jgi:hypothetical protein